MNDFMLGRRGGWMDDECRGDLLALEQRGEMSAADRLALEAHLADCASCRQARRVFADLADVGGVDPHDGVRIERMSNAARRWTHQRRPESRPFRRRRRPRFMGLAGWLLLIGGTASAAAWLWRSAVLLDLRHSISGDPRGARAENPARAGGPKPVLAAPAELAAPPIPAAAEGPAEDLAPARAPVRPPRFVAERSIRPSSRHAARTVADRDRGTPAALLRQASDARREGDDERATRLYRRLQAEFPQSAEATVASVPIGGILLERNSPRAALAAFDAYLGSSRGGSLIPEALYGRGRALAALGEAPEERRTWDRLLADFPDSAYAPLAKRRLAELK